MLDFVLQNWDVIGLLITNILAWFSKSPIKPKKPFEEL